MAWRTRRPLVAIALAVLFVFPAVSRLAPTVAAQVDGATYTSPTYGWSVSWDDETWTVSEETSEDEGDLLKLEDPLNTVYFESYEGFEGDALECIAAEVDELADQDAEEVTVGLDSNGDAISGGDSASAYAVYTFTYTLEDDVVLELVEYNECRRLSDDAVLEFSQLTVREAYNDASVAAQELLAAVTMPGDEPVDDPESPIGDGGDDAGDDDGQMNFTEITVVADDVSVSLNEYWAGVFKEKEIFYVAPIYEVFDEETSPPCSEEPIDAGVRGPFYCGLNQTVYLDLVIIQDVISTYGPTAIHYALAHEAGHDVQMQLGISWSGAPSVERELEADCMAGSFLASYVESGEMTEGEFYALLELANFIGDPPGITASDEGAHGLGSQRVAMLLRGYYNGVDSCGTFEV